MHSSVTRTVCVLFAKWRMGDHSEWLEDGGGRCAMMASGHVCPLSRDSASRMYIPGSPSPVPAWKAAITICRREGEAERERGNEPEGEGEDDEDQQHSFSAA